jgi:hypothetical protein
MTDPDVTPRRCSATNRSGEPCGCPPLRDRDTCSAHSPTIPDEARFGSSERARAAGHAGGRPRVERPTDLMRRLVHEHVAAFISPLFEVAGLDVRLVNGEVVVTPRPGGRAEMTEQQIAVVKVCNQVMDRVDGRARQQVEVSGPDGGPVDVNADGEWDLNKLSSGELATLQEMAVRAQRREPPA